MFTKYQDGTIIANTSFKNIDYPTLITQLLSPLPYQSTTDENYDVSNTTPPTGGKTATSADALVPGKGTTENNNNIFTLDEDF